MTDNCCKNTSYYFLCFSTYIPKVEGQELSSSPPSWILRYHHLSTILHCSGLGLWQVKHKHLKSCWTALEFKRQKCSQAALQEAASKTIKLDSSIPWLCHTPLELLPGGVYRGTSCHHVRPVQAGVSVPDFFSHPRSHLTAPSCGTTNTKHCILCSLLIMLFAGIKL